MKKYIVFAIIGFILFFTVIFNIEKRGNDEKNFEISSDIENSVVSDISVWSEMGKEYLNLLKNYDSSVISIVVNGSGIKKRDIEMLKIYNQYIENFDIELYINSMVKNLIIKTEAEKQNILPSDEKVKKYVNDCRKNITDRANGTETIFAFIESANCTIEDYLVFLEKSAYDMYQRDALWDVIKDIGKYNTYDDYISYLTKKSEIKILDEDIRMQKDGSIVFIDK